MKRNIYIILASIIIISILPGCNSDFHPKSVKHVVIIGIDGMSVGGLTTANTPNFDKYMANGAYSLNTRNILPTVSSPNWEAMLTGSDAAQTGVTSNDWRFNNYTLPPVVTTENGRYPDIFYAIKKSNSNLKTASVYHWDGFGNLYDKTNVDLDFDTENERVTAEKVAEIIKSEKPNFLFIQIDHVDDVGHTKGHMTPAYFKAVELADSLAGIIVESTKEAGIFDETLFIITADHGGIGFNHGDETVQGNEVPFILYGNSIKKGYKIPTVVNLFDLTATCAFALQVTRPQAWISRPIICAFEGSPEIDPSSLMGKCLAPSSYVPVISPRKTNGECGGLFIKEKAIVSIESAGKNGKIRYTTDGSIPTRESMEYTQPFEMTHSGVVKAAYFGDDGSQSAYSEGFYRVVQHVTDITGINYKLYKGKNWSKLPGFSALIPIEKGKTYEISVDELTNKISDYTGVVFEGMLTIEKEGDYSFTTRSDDGSKLFVDGAQIVDNDGDHGTREREGSIYLKPGKHNIRIEYFNGGGGCFLNATFKGPGIAKQIISPEKLTTK